jgi:predicted dehydrogenase
VSSSKELTRRSFLKNAAAGVAGAAAGLAAVPSLAARGFGQNDRIQMGVIGCGGMGTSHLRNLVNMSRDPKNGVAVVGVCDVYEARKQRAGEISHAKIHHEHEEMLARDDVDAVVIATPDHWHAQIALDALNAGKDVYLEKPMTHTWQQAREVWETVMRTGRVLQVGVQSTSEDRWWRANNWIKTGQIGKLLWTKSSYCRNSVQGEWNWGIDPDAGPHNIDWKRWLGPAPWRPWDPDRFFRFRKYWDYSGGIATDLFYHQLGHLAVAVGPEFPRYVSAQGGIYVQHDREVPDTFHMMIDYPSQHTIVLCSSMANRVGVEESIHGHEATLYFDGGGFRRVPEDEFKDKHQEMRVRERPRSGHMENFLECVRTRQRPDCDAETAFKVMVAIALGVQAYRERRTIEFDPQNLRVVEGPRPYTDRPRPPFG